MYTGFVRLLSFLYPPEFPANIYDATNHRVVWLWNDVCFSNRCCCCLLYLYGFARVEMQSGKLIWIVKGDINIFKEICGDELSKRYRHALSNNFIFLYTYIQRSLWMSMVIYSNVFLVVLCAWCHILFDKTMPVLSVLLCFCVCVFLSLSSLHPPQGHVEIMSPVNIVLMYLSGSKRDSGALCQYI